MLPQTKSKVVKRSTAILLQQIDGQKPNRARDVWHENIVQLFCQAKGRSASGHVSISQFCFCPSVWLHEIAYPPFFEPTLFLFLQMPKVKVIFVYLGDIMMQWWPNFPMASFLRTSGWRTSVPHPKKNLSCIVHIHSEKER